MSTMIENERAYSQSQFFKKIMQIVTVRFTAKTELDVYLCKVVGPNGGGDMERCT